MADEACGIQLNLLQPHAHALHPSLVTLVSTVPLAEQLSTSTLLVSPALRGVPARPHYARSQIGPNKR